MKAERGAETVKINEVETLVGITKKNIRFYEEQGLLRPRRNSENGYRDYGEEEVETLRRIKLLRKLGIPIEEIRQMQSGRHTVADAMHRHLVTLEREGENLRRAMELCALLKDREERLEALDAQAILEEMEIMEQAGTSFRNRQKLDVRTHYVAAAMAAAVMVLLMVALMVLILWAFQTDPVGAPPLPIVVVLVLLPGVVAAGVLLAMAQRIREIGKGEMDDARKY